MINFLLLSTLDNTRELREAMKEIKEEYGEILSLRKIYFSDWDKKPDYTQMEEAISNAQVILVDIRGQSPFTDWVRQAIAGSSAIVAVLVGGHRDIMSLTRMGSFSGSDIPSREGAFDVEAFLKVKKFSELTKKLGSILPLGKLKHMRNWVVACDYYAEGGTENLKNLFLFMLKEYCGKKVKVQPPQKMLDWGIWWPDQYFPDLKSFISWRPIDKNKPTVGIFFYGGMHFADCTPAVEALIERMGDQVNLLPVFSKAEYNLPAMQSCFFDEGRPVVDLVVNLQYFQLHGGPYGGAPEPTYELLSKLDVPVIIGFHSYSTGIREWQRENRLNPVEIVLGVVLPELDGCIEPIYIAGLSSCGEDDLLEGEVKESRALPEGIDRLAGRILKWLYLRRKANAEKKLAIILYDYPPGEAHLGNAGYLDALTSLSGFLEKLVERGYQVTIPEGDLGEYLLSSGVVNTPEWQSASPEVMVDAAVYQKWYRSLPPDLQEEMERNWGEPPGDIMTKGNQFIIPGVFLGNIFIGVQPSRGVHEDPARAYHDKELPPHHQYLCFYRWLQQEFQADCMLHWGMHGTLEFTKGKEVPVSRKCYPEILTGDIPHLYYYWVGNPSESTIAKRRSYAVTISHASPPVTASNLYGEYLELEDLLVEYRKDEGQDKEKLAVSIREKAGELTLPAGDLTELETYLYRMKRRLIPKGMHVLDRMLSGEDLLCYLKAIVRFDREVPSLYRLFAEQRGVPFGNLIQDAEAFAAVDSQVHQAIESWLAGEQAAVPEEIDAYLHKVKENIECSSESEGLLSVLDGRYVLPNLAGDPVRTPEIYPVGRNMYEFNPQLIPTQLALERGARTASTVLYKYYQDRGRYPESVGMVLWGFETLSTGGETVAQILNYLGVRMVRKGSPWFKELQLIPLEELGRPRIDVFITICGIFRDICGNQIEMINQAVEMAAGAEEADEQNYVRKHALELGADQSAPNCARIFGPSASEYGTSMRTLVESGVWQEEKELVDSYDSSMSYCYYQGNVQENSELFDRLVSKVDLISQVRHSNEYEFTDLDHYYEFFGGLSRSVAEKKGDTPEQWVVDATEEITEVVDVGLSIDRAVRTRLFNPRWIDGMLNHKHHGAQKVAQRVEHLIGLRATTGKVDKWVFHEATARFVLDEEMRQRLSENNPYAAREIAEKLAEALERGYFELTEEEYEQFRDAVLEMEAWIEEET